MKRAIAAVALVAAGGIVVGLWMPRGPLTGPQAISSVLLSSLAGLAAGLVLRSRWALLAAPVAFWTTVEICRTRVQGPSADAPEASAFGLIVLISGRGVQLLLTAVPMVLGAAYGVGLTRRRRLRGLPARLRQVAAAVTSIGVLALTVAAAIPPRTAREGRDVAQLASVDSGGHRLGVMLRGAHADLPVLLIVPGPPGGSETGAVRRHLAALEESFVVATLDRRGGGASYPALDTGPPITVETEIADILAVTDYLRRRFAEKRIILAGHSGGSLLGVLAVQRHPERFRAYVGTGQAVNLPDTDRIAYADLADWARRTGRTDLARSVAAQGPPPYADVYGYEPIMLHQSEVYAQKDIGLVLDVPEYSLLQKAHTMTALLDTWSALYPRMQGIDLRIDAPRIDVPVYFFQGGNEMRSIVAPFTSWYGLLQAPAKHLETVPGAGHRAMFDEPARFADLMVRVLSETVAS